MTIFIKTTLVLLAPLAFVSCKKEADSSTETSTPAAAETSAKPYPLDICLVSGEELGSMGDPVVIVHEGQTIKFCCDKCVPKFKADPDKYLAQLNGEES